MEHCEYLCKVQVQEDKSSGIGVNIIRMYVWILLFYYFKKEYASIRKKKNSSSKNLISQEKL